MEDTEQTSSTDVTTSVVIVEEERNIVKRGPYKKTKSKTSFLKPKGHDLDKAIKQSGRYLETALQTLVFVATDHQIDPKERRQAAESIIKLHKDMVGQRDKDEIERLKEEISKLGLIGQGSVVEEEDDDTPELDFDNIQEEFRDKEAESVEFEEKISSEEEKS